MIGKRGFSPEGLQVQIQFKSHRITARYRVLDFAKLDFHGCSAPKDDILSLAFMFQP